MNVFEGGVAAAVATGYPYVAAMIPPGVSTREAFGPACVVHVFTTEAGAARVAARKVHPEIIRHRHALFFACQAIDDLRYLLAHVKAPQRVGYRVVEGLTPDAPSGQGGTA